jgi:hypothetical protein
VLLEVAGLASAGGDAAAVEAGGGDDGVAAGPADVSGVMELVVSEGGVTDLGLPILESRELRDGPRDGLFHRRYPRPAATASTRMMTSIFQALLLGGSSSSSR